MTDELRRKSDDLILDIKIAKGTPPFTVSTKGIKSNLHVGK
jgi:hypothetical protein